MQNLALQLDPNLDTPLYRQLSEAIERAILCGTLKRGDRLPPTRHLCATLKMARRTVVKAYDELLSKGYLEGRVGAGTTVSRHLPLQLEQSSIQSHDDHTWEPPNHFGFAETQPLSSDNAFGGLSLPGEMVPFKQWRKSFLQSCREENAPLLTIGDYTLELREAICQYLARTRGVVCQPRQIVLFSSHWQAMRSLVKLAVQPGDSVIVENPCNPLYRELVEQAGARIQPVDADNSGLIVDALADLDGSAMKMALVSPTCQLPTGAIMPLERRERLVNWAKERKVLLVEDAIETDFRYGSQSAVSLQGMSPANVVYIYGFEKLLQPLTSIAVAVVPLHMVEAMESARGLFNPGISTLECSTLAGFLRNGEFDGHARKLRRTLQERRQVLLHSLFICFRQAVEILPRAGGSNLFVKFESSFEKDAILECAHKAGIPLVDAGSMFHNAVARNVFLIPFAYLDPVTLPDKMEAFTVSLLHEKNDSCDKSVFDCSATGSKAVSFDSFVPAGSFQVLDACASSAHLQASPLDSGDFMRSAYA